MIDHDDIKSKDFSISMNTLVYKLELLTSSCLSMEPAPDRDRPHFEYWWKDFVGMGLILREVKDDLKTIYEALYCSDESEKEVVLCRLMTKLLNLWCSDVTKDWPC